jgi:citrate lyase subunit beta/citryl-CoA lyase
MRRLRRSKLFVPGNRADFMEKATASAADALSFDLEDAVAPAEKETARLAVARFLAAAEPKQEMIVRVNALDTGLLFDDVIAVACANLHVVNVPKVESPRDLHVADELLTWIERKKALEPGAIRLMPTLESAAGLRRAFEIDTASPRVVALQFGAGDLKASARIEPGTERLRSVRLMVVLAAAEAGVEALDSAFTDIRDLAAFEVDAAESRRLGFHGKSCIHPSQVEIANRAFAPSAQEIAEAKSLLAAYEDALARGLGAIQHDGKLVDAPFADIARRVLEAAGEAKQR